MTKDKENILYQFFTILFCVIVITSNLITPKLIQAPLFPAIALPVGLITYPLTFLISDLVTEVFGSSKAKMMIYLGLFMSLAVHVLVQMALLLPPHPQFDPSAYHEIFGFSGIAISSSMAAYVVCQVLDVYVFDYLKKATQGRHLWFRTNGSTLISQFIDTLIVMTIQLYWGFKMEIPDIIKAVTIGYSYKAFFSICNTPLFYLGNYLCRYYLSKNMPEQTQAI